jgi:type VI secretion system secreted protein VgrG
MGAFSTFGILANTYTNTLGGTVINGDLGYNNKTLAPALSPTVTGTTYAGGDTYDQAGASLSTKLHSLNALPCTFTFKAGAVDLATDTSHGVLGVYTPNIYCITGAASIGTAGISLSGSGTFVFRMTGALTTVASSSVSFLDVATPCDLWWTPGAATTLGPSSTFAGNIIDNFGITTGAHISWEGRALSFIGTVSTDADTLTVPFCSQTSSPTPTPAPTSTPTPTPTKTPTPTPTPTKTPTPTPTKTPTPTPTKTPTPTPTPTKTPTPTPTKTPTPTPTPTKTPTPTPTQHCSDLLGPCKNKSDCCKGKFLTKCVLNICVKV